VGETENAHAVLTVIFCRATNPCSVAVISALPDATATISPLADTETLLASDEPHCTFAVSSCVVASESVACAWHCAVWPSAPSAPASQLTASAEGVVVGAVGVLDVVSPVEHADSETSPTQAIAARIEHRGNRMLSSPPVKGPQYFMAPPTSAIASDARQRRRLFRSLANSCLSRSTTILTLGRSAMRL
jgi:hypothetical protein